MTYARDAFLQGVQDSIGIDILAGGHKQQISLLIGKHLFAQGIERCCGVVAQEDSAFLKADGGQVRGVFDAVAPQQEEQRQQRWENQSHGQCNARYGVERCLGGFQGSVRRIDDETKGGGGCHLQGCVLAFLK